MVPVRGTSLPELSASRMELQELPRHHAQDAPSKTLQDSAEEPIQKTQGQLRKAKSTAENPSNDLPQRSASTRRLRSTCSNIIMTPRPTKNPILRFLILLSPQKWWARNISLVVEHTSSGPRGGDPRDYLALERTFLSWVRTATTLVSFGVIITQLFVFKKVDVRKGSVLGAFTSAGGILVVLIGCVRYFKQQQHLTHGNATSAGWEIMALLIILVAILLVVLVVVLVQA